MRATRAMRWCGWLLVAACSGDPSLDVSVHHPTGYAVVQTVVTVYSGDDINCGQIEYGDRTDSELAAITVDEVDVTGGGQIDVSRLGGKSIVARGFDGQHRFVTAGCQDLGEITSGAGLAIDTQPTAVVAIDPAQPDRPFNERSILLDMTDSNGAALDGMVSWQLSGPAGAVEPVPAAPVRTQRGDTKIDVQDLGTPGPEGLRLRVPWAIAPLPLVTAFDLSHATTLTLPGVSGPITGTGAVHPSCDVRGHAGKPPSLICLTQPDMQDHRDAVEIAWQTDHYELTAPIRIPASMTNQFALFVDHNGVADEPVYVLSANALGTGSWYKLGAASGAPISFDGALQDLIYVPRCQDNAVTAMVGVQTRTALADRQQLFLPTGAAIAASAEGELFAGGCVADVDKHEHQAIVASDGPGDANLFVFTSTGQKKINGARLTGSGFVAVEAQGVVEKRFAGTRLQASGTVVFEAVLQPEADTFKLFERTELDAAAPPTKILGGKLDQDGDTDLMWDMAVGARRKFVQVSLAKHVNGVPLTAMTSGPTQGAVATTPSDFVVGNLDGGHTDKMIVFTSSAVTIYAAD